MIRFTDITFHANSEYLHTNDLLKAQRISLYYADVLKEKMDVEVVKHIVSGETQINAGNGFFFFQAKNKRGYIGRETRDYLIKRKPQIVLVRGLSFPLHVLRLKWLLPASAKVLVMHHADKPPTNRLRRFVYKLADACINGYLFTARDNAAQWIDAGIIHNAGKIHEIPGTLTNFERLDKNESRDKTGIEGSPVFLWVGRLDANKDPMTVISGFEMLLDTCPSARLYMIYQADGLIDMVKQRLRQKNNLEKSVKMMGKIAYEDLPGWYSASDFFISSSHSESGSAALLEAMACGCIPVVTSIPPSMKVTGRGQYGFYFTPGDPDSLYIALTQAMAAASPALSEKIIHSYQQEYSVNAVARKLHAVCNTLLGE